MCALVHGSLPPTDGPSRADPSFATLLEPWRLERLEADSSVVLGLSPDLKILYVNPAWDRFAHENGGEAALSARVLGTSMLASMPSLLRDFYTTHLDRVMESHTRWQWTYECSSAALERKFQMLVYPLTDRSGFIISHSLVVEQEHRRAACDPILKRYLNQDQLVVQCSECRRTRSCADPLRWDWVPSFVEHPLSDVSHGLCAICLGAYVAAADEFDAP